MKGFKIVLVGSLMLVVYLFALGEGVASQTNEVVFHYAHAYENMTWDPAVNLDSPTSLCIFNTYDPLMMPVKGKAPVPWVAESFTASADGMTYTFKIREGIKFHDGTDLTAEDVAFSMNRMMTLKQGYSFLWSGTIEPGDTKAVDKYTVVFHLRKVIGPFVATLVQFNIVNKDLCLKEKKAGDFGEFGDYGQEYLATHDVGSGPFRLESVELGAKYTLTKFADYWKGWRKNQIDRVEVEIIPETATRLLKFKKGELDMIDQATLQNPRLRDEVAAIKGVRVQEDPETRLVVIQMNNKKPPLDDIYVRKAISYAFDYKSIKEEVFKGGELAQGPVPLIIPGHAGDVIQYHQDLEKAKFFLSKSRYSKNELEKMELEFAYITGHATERLWGLVLINSLEPLGLKVKLRGEPWTRLVAMSTKAETTSHFMAIFVASKYGSVDIFTYGMYHPASWGTYMSNSWYENPEVSELLEKARITVDTEQRYELYRRAQRIIAFDAPGIFMLNPINRVGLWDHVKDYVFIGITDFDLKFYNLSIEK